MAHSVLLERLSDERVRMALQIAVGDDATTVAEFEGDPEVMLTIAIWWVNGRVRPAAQQRQ